MTRLYAYWEYVAGSKASFGFDVATMPGRSGFVVAFLGTITLVGFDWVDSSAIAIRVQS